MAQHMTPEEFRHYGRMAVDWVADYWERIDQLPVLSQAEPGTVRDQLPAHPPEQGESFDGMLADLDRVILPGITHWQHPRFFGYFPSNISGPSVLGELLSAGLGVQGMLWATSPACTELEQLVLDWLAELLDLPERFRSTGTGGGVIQDSASSATLVALLAALHQQSDGQTRQSGTGSRYRVYASTQAHSSVLKAVMIAGLGEQALRQVDADQGTQRMNVEHLRELMAADRAAGLQPVMVVASVGTTSTGAVDPVAEIGPVCREQDVWLHVDAAHAGTAAVCPELRWINKGVAEFASSYCTNPHKWLLTNWDCDTFWVADRRPLLGALSVLPEYLRNSATDSGAVVDYRDWQIPLGRRFRALKLWTTIRWYGAQGLQAHIRDHVAMAGEFAKWVNQDPRFEVVGAPSLSLVCFRIRGASPEEDDRRNQLLMDQLNASGELLLTHTKVDGRLVLRMAIGSPSTTLDQVSFAWKRIQDVAGRLAV